MSNAFSYISNPKFWPHEPPKAARRPCDRGLAHHYHRYTHYYRHYLESHPGHHPRERIGRIDRIWGLILGGVSGSSPIAFPSVLVDHEY